MQKLTTVTALRRQIFAWKEKGEKIVFVPTMGNLHVGHFALLHHAKKISGKVICSIFVNALQFDCEDDLLAYPCTPQHDLRALQNIEVDIAFMPEPAEIYSKVYQINVPDYPLSQQLCGEFRPGFFAGIMQVVARLFKIVTPDIAVFGEKDYQQLIIIRQLVKDLGMPIQLQQVPTQREADGLACSSRNSYLDETERKLASSLYAVLVEVKQQIQNHGKDFSELEKYALQRLKLTGFRPDYVAIRDANTLAKPDHTIDFIIILAAAWLGGTRLIDNILLQMT